MTDWFDEPRYLTAHALLAAGALSPTLRAWRNNNGLFDDRRRSGETQIFSLTEVCALRLVQHLCERGLAAQRSCDVAMRLIPLIADVLAGRPVRAARISFDVAADRGAIRIKTLPSDEPGDGSPAPVMSLLVNLESLASYVLARLKEIDSPTVATPGETGAIMAAALAKVFGSDAEPVESTAPAGVPARDDLAALPGSTLQ